MGTITELTDKEIERAVNHLEEMWPKASAIELMKMSANERDLMGLLAATLKAVPVDEEGHPLR